MLYPCNPAVVAWAFYSLFFGCCHCFAKPAVMHCMGANPAVFLLLALVCQAVLGCFSLQASG